MLHDPSHYEARPEAKPIEITANDKAVLRSIASEVAEIAALPVHAEKAQLWTKLNDLQSERPMVWINEICWNEMNVDDELTLQCEDSWARQQETGLRQELYQWRHRKRPGQPGKVKLAGSPSAQIIQGGSLDSLNRPFRD